ncbi:MAG TPA: hypothetical protein VGQ82_07160, partial [Chthoniobacterales bacterium]|nr:hypothetical protein [Chthoniobacterales bacterium]
MIRSLGIFVVGVAVGLLLAFVALRPGGKPAPDGSSRVSAGNDDKPKITAAAAGKPNPEENNI